PVARWTRATVTEVVAIARAELAARGAPGAPRISVKVDDNWKVTSVEVAVRVGNLRASLTIDAGTVRYELPHEVLYTLSEMVPNTPQRVRTAIDNARQRDAEAGAAGGVLWKTKDQP